MRYGKAHLAASSRKLRVKAANSATQPEALSPSPAPGLLAGAELQVGAGPKRRPWWEREMGEGVIRAEMLQGPQVKLR